MYTYNDKAYTLSLITKGCIILLLVAVFNITKSISEKEMDNTSSISTNNLTIADVKMEEV